jgi:hypothetical protein
VCCCGGYSKKIARERAVVKQIKHIFKMVNFFCFCIVFNLKVGVYSRFKSLTPRANTPRANQQQ